MEALIDRWSHDPDSRVAHIHTVPASEPILKDPDPPLAEPLPTLLRDLGIDRLYRHQTQAIDNIRAGKHTVVVAGTASGKSLCYQLPIAESILADESATALAVYPTKALAQDQLRSIHQL